jgi:hypothetical protein
MGNDGRHLRLKLKDADARSGPVTWPAVAFDFGEAAMEQGQRVDVVYSLAVDRRGDALELRVKDLAPAGQNQSASGGQNLEPSSP